MLKIRKTWKLREQLAIPLHLERTNFIILVIRYGFVASKTVIYFRLHALHFGYDRIVTLNVKATKTLIKNVIPWGEGDSSFKDWSTLFCLHWEMKGHRRFALHKIYSRPVSFTLHKIYTWSVSFHFLMQNKKDAFHKIYTWPVSFHFPVHTKSALQSLYLC